MEQKISLNSLFIKTAKFAKFYVNNIIFFASFILKVLQRETGNNSTVGLGKRHEPGLDLGSKALLNVGTPSTWSDCSTLLSIRHTSNSKEIE